MSTRTRTQGALVSGDPVTHYYLKCTKPGTTCAVTQQSVGTCSMPLIGTDIVTEDEWPHKYPAKGTYSVSPFNKVKRTASFGGSGMKRKDTNPYNSCNSGSCTYNGWTVGDEWGYFLTTWSGVQNQTRPVCTDWTALRSTALNSAIANAKTPEVMGLVFLAEIQQTLNLITKPWAAIADMIVAYRKRSARLTAKAAASAHLQFVFGVLPLMRDVESGLKILQSDFQEMQRFYGSVSDTYHSESTSTSNNGIDQLSVKTIIHEDVSVYAGVAYFFDSHTTADRFGLSISQIPSALWEAIPFSFILDWAINVGDYIAALTPISGARYMGGYTLVKSRISVRREVISHTSVAPTWSIMKACSDWDEIVFETKQRFPESGAVSLPTYNLRLNTGKVASILSLLTQYVTRR